jgi:hypothetical protein
VLLEERSEGPVSARAEVPSPGEGDPYLRSESAITSIAGASALASSMPPSTAKTTKRTLDPAANMMEGRRVAIRKTKASAPTTTQPLMADDVPVTRAMLGGVRTELLQRIDQARAEAKADAQRLDGKLDGAKAELKAEIQEVKAELKAEIQGVRAELKAEIQEVKADVHEVKAGMHAMQAGMHAMQAQMARIETLVEEQNARNKVVLDGITAVLSRQDQVEQRVSQVEDTVRKLASARSPEGPG